MTTLSVAALSQTVGPSRRVFQFVPDPVFSALCFLVVVPNLKVLPVQQHWVNQSYFVFEEPVTQGQLPRRGQTAWQDTQKQLVGKLIERS